MLKLYLAPALLLFRAALAATEVHLSVLLIVGGYVAFGCALALLVGELARGYREH